MLQDHVIVTVVLVTTATGPFVMSKTVGEGDGEGDGAGEGLGEGDGGGVGDGDGLGDGDGDGEGDGLGDGLAGTRRTVTPSCGTTSVSFGARYRTLAAPATDPIRVPIINMVIPTMASGTNRFMDINLRYIG